jgi:hypothetical protein
VLNRYLFPSASFRALSQCIIYLHGIRAQNLFSGRNSTAATTDRILENQIRVAADVAVQFQDDEEANPSGRRRGRAVSQRLRTESEVINSSSSHRSIQWSSSLIYTFENSGVDPFTLDQAWPRALPTIQF